jgi:IS1 family transposase
MKARRVQCDEIWLHVLQGEERGDREAEGLGLWRRVDVDCAEADTKLLVTYMVGGRDADYALAVMDDLRQRITNRVQLATDGHSAYLQAVEEAFGADIDYAQLVKLYGTAPEAMRGCYSPAECIGAREEEITGRPDPAHVSTSYVERANLTMRMAMRGFTRLTNAFSKKLANHCHMVALYATWYDFIKPHKTPKRLTPAMAAGVSDTLWTMENVVALIDARAAKPNRPTTYRKRSDAA